MTLSTRTRLLASLLLLLTVAPQLRADAKPTTRPATKPANALPEGVKLIPNLEYASVDGKSLLLDLYLPEEIDKPVPVILWVHGGGWLEGNRHGAAMLGMVAAKGYAVASIEYRFSNVAIYPAQIHDCKAAVRWIRAHASFYGMDGAHIGAWGASAGGHLVALLGTTGDHKELEGDEGNLDQSSRVQCVCDWFGPTDFPHYAEQAKASGLVMLVDPNAPKSLIGKLLGGAVPDHMELAAAASPMTYVSKNSCPFLIMHGDRDILVPLAQSLMLDQALQNAGVESHLEIIYGAGHGFGNAKIFKQVETFFDSHLKVAKNSPTTKFTEAKAEAPPKPDWSVLLKKNPNPDERSVTTVAEPDAGHLKALLVTQVKTAGAVDRFYGIRKGDKITTIGDYHVGTSDSLANAQAILSEAFIRQHEIKVIRGDKELTLPILPDAGEK